MSGEEKGKDQIQKREELKGIGKGLKDDGSETCHRQMI